MFPYISLCCRPYISFCRTNKDNDKKYSINNERLILAPPSNLSSLYNEFNSMSSDLNNNPDNVINCQYYDVQELQNLNLNSEKSLSLFHINISSLSKHQDDLEHLLNSLKIDFDVIAISETRISINNSSSGKTNLNNLSFEYCATQSAAGGTALYIKNTHTFIPIHDLSIYKSLQLESNFVEIVLPKKSNIIVGCIYRHPHMSLEEFNEDYLNLLSDKLSKENKKVFLLGDFNVDLLKYDHHSLTNKFLDSLSSNLFLPNIVLPTRICGQSKTLIDNIFSNVISPGIMSGNISASISDHLPQFSIFPEIFGESPSTKSNIFERDWSQFDQQSFVLDFFAIDWSTKIDLNANQVNSSFENFLNVINSLLDEHAPMKKVSKHRLKFRNKPWITKAIQKSINVKNL